MCEINIEVSCPHCQSVKVKKNGRKKTGKQNFLCQGCRKQFPYKYVYKGADPKNKAQARLMTLNGSGIRDIHRVTKLSLVCILSILRKWFKQNKEPCFEGSYGQVQLDELWTFVKHRNKGKRWVWYAYDKDRREDISLSYWQKK